MEISYLSEYPDFIFRIAPSIVDHWKPIVGEETIGTRIAKLEGHLHTQTMPIAWLAHENGKGYGVAALRTHDLEGREELSPWLGGVFILPEYRGRGIASALCKAVDKKAWALGFQVLYLFTLDQGRLYSRIGWQTLETALWHGHKGLIMFRRKIAT